MAVHSLPLSMTVEDYLGSSCEHDCDYVDGHLEERGLGAYDHSRIQALLILWFGNHETDWGIVTLAEQRVRVSETRYRVPDVCILGTDQPKESILRRPPLICIEILSPEDSLVRVQAKIDDYVEMGVPNVWLIDPSNRTGRVCTEGVWSAPEDGVFKVAGAPIRVPLPEIFARLDRS